MIHAHFEGGLLALKALRLDIVAGSWLPPGLGMFWLACPGQQVAASSVQERPGQGRGSLGDSNQYWREAGRCGVLPAGQASLLSHAAGLMIGSPCLSSVVAC